MLILTRKKDQAIIIGDDISIKIVEVKGDTVKIGISAPRTVSVHRQEIYEEITRENTLAVITEKDLKIEELCTLLSKKSSKV